MITRGRPKKRTEDTDKEDKETTPVEEMEMIEEIIEEDAQEEPTQPATEVEVIISDQPEKQIQDSEREQQAGDHDKAKGGPSMQDLMNFIAENLSLIHI